MIDPILSNQIGEQLGLLEADTSDAKLKKDAQEKIKELKNLLIEYILAKMTGNTAQLKEIGKKIDAVLNAFSKEVDLFKQAHALIQAIQADPSSETNSTLRELELLNQEIKEL